MIHFKTLVTHSSPLSGISCWYRTSCMANLLVTLKRVTSGWRVNRPCKCQILNKIQGFGWWVGDECSKMNHRCNPKSHNNLQRWGWRVDELYENSFFSKRCYPPVRVWRVILKNAKADFAMSGLQVHFFAKDFIEGGGTLLPLLGYNTLIINWKWRVHLP